LAFSVVCGIAGAHAQDVQPLRDPWFVRFGYTPGFVLPVAPFVSGENAAGTPIERYRSVTVEVGWQTSGDRPGHRVNQFPSWGVGLRAGRFDLREEVGDPVSVYTFASWPFARPTERLHLATELGAGIAWNWKKYDPESNPYNTAIGSSVTYHITSGLYVRYLASPRVSLYTGVDFTHWSNGGTQQPNGGLNAIGPKIALRYNLAPQPLRPESKPWPPFTPAWEFVVGGAGGLRNVNVKTSADPATLDRNRSFGAFNLTSGVHRHFHHLGKFAAGADLTYDGSTGARLDLVNGVPVESRPPAADRFSVGLYGGFEHVFYRLGVLVQLGYTAWRGFDDPDAPRAYQRYGCRLYVGDRVWATMAVRTIHWGKATFVEFGGGYRVRWPRREN